MLEDRQQRRHQHGQDDEREDEVDPHGDAADLGGDVALQAPPDEGLIDLVQSEQEWQPGDGQVLGSTLQVPARVDPDGGDDDAAGDVAHGRKAHRGPSAPGLLARLGSGILHPTRSVAGGLRHLKAALPESLGEAPVLAALGPDLDEVAVGVAQQGAAVLAARDVGAWTTATPVAVSASKDSSTSSHQTATTIAGLAGLRRHTVDPLGRVQRAEPQRESVQRHLDVLGHSLARRAVRLDEPEEVLVEGDARLDVAGVEVHEG